MLVASAAVGLISPLAAQATDINLVEMNSYSRSSKTSRGFKNNFSNVQPSDWAFQSIKDLAVAKGCDISMPNKSISRYQAASILNSCLSDVVEVTEIERKLINEFSQELALLKGRVDGIEAKFNAFEAGGFSDTTTLDGKAIFTIGGAEHDGTRTEDGSNNDPNKSNSIAAQYSYQMNLNSSFTGDDNLYVRLKTGNAAGWMVTEEQGGYLSSSKANSDEIKVDKIWYTFPLGDNFTVWIGPEIENYYMHATTPSIYSPTLKQFTLGGNASAYGASTNSGFGVAYDFDNGWALSTNVVSKQTNSASAGLLTNEAETSWATQLGYTQPQYSASILVNQKYNGWSDIYFSTSDGASRANSANSTNVGLRGWWRPAETGTVIPSISLGYDTSDVEGATAGAGNSDMWFMGLNWADIVQPDDKIGAAMGQPQTREDETMTPFSWEAYYQFQVNDATSIRSTVFGNIDRDGTKGNDNTGFVVESTFKF